MLPCYEATDTIARRGWQSACAVRALDTGLATLRFSGARGQAEFVRACTLDQSRNVRAYVYTLYVVVSICAAAASIRRPRFPAIYEWIGLVGRRSVSGRPCARMRVAAREILRLHSRGSLCSCTMTPGWPIRLVLRKKIGR